MTHKKPVHIADARVVHYAVGQYPNVTRTTIVLCDRHRQSFYSLHSGAFDYGESAGRECAHCAIDVPR
jgi:hypothetical protein